MADRLYFEAQGRPKLVNEIQKGTHWTKAAEVKLWREAFGLLGKGHRGGIDLPVMVRAHHLRKTKQSVDVGAILWAAKAGIDGLVDAGVLPEDDPKYVRELSFPAPEIVGYDGVALELVTVR